MSKKTICVQSPARISTKRGRLVIETDKGRAEPPLEDIWVLIVESHMCQVTTAALSALAGAGIGTMTCGKNHMPNGLLLPIGAHSRHAAIVEHQLLMSKPLKKRLWQKIVKTKIENQASALDLLGLDGGDKLRQIAGKVLSGDPDNREGVAASCYFKQLIEDGTRRDSGMTAALDYGYAVLRAGIGREAVAGGWLVSRGIHHCSDLNAFNLVDDLIEPFRPVVDMIACGLPTGELTSEGKADLAAVFEEKVVVDGAECTVQSAISAVLDGFRRAALADDASLMPLPRLAC